jgi:hypothetical protein
VDATVGSNELERIAVAHSYKPSLVRQLVDERLLEPALQRRDDAGRLVWEYPAANTRRLRLVLTLRALGYRGDAVHFLLWWYELHPFPDLVLGQSSYLKALGYRAVPRFVEHVLRDCIVAAREAIVAKTGGSTGGRLDSAKLRKLFQKVPVTTVVEVIRSRAISRGQKVDDGFLSALQAIGLPSTLWLFGIRPSDIGYNPVSRINDVRPAIHHSEIEGAKQLAQLVPAALHTLDQPGAIDGVYRLIRSASPKLWERSRLRVRTDTEARHLRRAFTVGIARSIRAKDIGFSARLLRRHASFRHVTSTILAVQFVVPILLEHFAPGVLDDPERTDDVLVVA